MAGGAYTENEFITIMALVTMLAPMISSVILLFFRYLEVRKEVAGGSQPHGIPLYTKILGVGSLGVSFLASVIFSIAYAQEYIGEEKTAVVSQLSMIRAGEFDLHFGFMVDPLSMLMTLLLAFIALMIHFYALEYMAHEEPEVTRFFAFLNFFTASMFGFVLSGNLFHSFIFWELLGVSSYFLIGYYWQKQSASSAATKAFLYNKIGDVAFMGAIFLILATPYNTAKTLDYHLLFNQQIPAKVLILPGILLFGAAVGKSAQVPLLGWLPEAMEGPTPVSALLHSSTMVKAGLFLLIRNFLLFYELDDYHLAVLPEIEGIPAAAIVLYIGTLTALAGASMAVVENDFKRILAFSTISQLGYIAMAIGAGGSTAGFYHLISHATFKSLLFLTAGAVIHNTNNTKDIRKMGGLYHKMPLTAIPTLIGLVSLMGFPFITSGFYSKDAVLLAVEKAHDIPGYEVMYYLGVFTAFLTAFYSTRLFLEVFFGKTEDGKDKVFDGHPHESGRIMLIPLWVLSAAAVIEMLIFALGTFTKVDLFLSEEYLAEVLGVHGYPFEWAGAVLSSIAVLLGLGLGLLLYHFSPGLRPTIRENPVGRALAKIAENRFGLDLMIMGFGINIVARRVSPAVAKVDEVLIDEYIINTFVAQGTLGLGEVSEEIDKKVIDGVIDGSWKLTAKLARNFRRLQNGLTGDYAKYMIVAVIVVLTVFNTLSILSI